MKELGVLAMPAPVTEWAVFYEPDDKMIYKGGYWPQVMVVRDQLAALVSETYEEKKEKVSVVSTHCSKSIVLPVFYFEAQGVRFWLRYNFYNWNVSVDATSSTPPALGAWVESFDDAHDYCYCEGMQAQRFPSYRESPGKFTVCVSDHYELYTFFWLFRRALGIKGKDSR